MNLKYALTMLIQGSSPGTASKYLMVSEVMKARGRSIVKAARHTGASVGQLKLLITRVGPFVGGAVVVSNGRLCVSGN